MIKINKSISLLTVIFLIISNIAFAQAADSFESDSNTQVSTIDINSKEKEMMGRFMKGELSEDKMRSMAKEKFGNAFDEMEFQKGIIELKDRMKRKEAFSYENEGFRGKYDIGPSYEGYSKEHMVFGMIFEYIGDDIAPREIQQYCNDHNKIADIIIGKLKKKVGDIQNICSKAEEHEAKCTEIVKKGCSQIGTPFVREGATEQEKIQSVAYSCPANKDAIVQACKLRAKFYMEQRAKNVDESCEKRFDFEGQRLMKECARFKQYQACDKEKFMNQCMGGIKKEDFERKQCPEYHVPACGEGQKLRDKTDSDGCVYYYCEATTTNICPPASVPQCAEGTAFQKKVDDKGCVYYYCSAPKCPEISKPTCNTDETLQAYYDNAGCATSYQCIRQQTCPEVAKPACSEGQSLTAKYDDKGCIIGYECIRITSNNTFTTITGGVILRTYNDLLLHCENSWKDQERMCSNMQGECNTDAFIEKCKEQENKNNGDFVSKIDQHCETETASEISAAEQRCSRIGEERQRCLEQNTKRCEQMNGTAQQCKDLLTEERLRDFIVEEAKKRCKFTGIIQNEEELRRAERVEIILAVLNTATQDDLEKLKLFVDDLHDELKLQDTTVYKGTIDPNRFGDIKLLSFVVNAKISTAVSSERSKEVKEGLVTGHKAEEVASKLVSLRDSDLPSEYLYIIEDKASDVLNVSDKLGEVQKNEEQKGIGYKIRLFLGLAKKAEQEEIKQLEDGKEKLKNSTETLTTLIDEVPSDVVKAVLREQVDNLKKQQEDIGNLIKSKEKKAQGLLGIFG